MTRYLIGIDLGTTNSALAYIDLASSKPGTPAAIHPFAMPQLVAPADVAPRPLLPSFLYLPGAHDLPAGATALPWNPACDYAVGEFARNHGAKVPGRLATSAKSWLCHAGVDRSAPLLPWSAPPDVQRISPVEASTRFLRHMAEAWNHTMAAKHPEYRIEKCPVVLTVPASFDDMARTLTVEAARKAGIENLTLLEEPQAAFYCWLATHSPHEAAQLKPGDHCLVVDVGGGTTDFSLIQAAEDQGELTFLRQAVGDHLLLGGDNMDLALAKFIETKVPAAGKLDAAQYGMLTQACRQGKETLLGVNPPDTHSVTVMGRGRSVIGGSLHATLTPDDVRRIILDGFFSVAPRDAEPTRGARAGLHEMGLPYVNDPAITRHLASFLKRHLRGAGDSPAPEGARAGEPPAPRPPAAILFNGGVFTANALRERVVEVLHQWFDGSQKDWRPLVLTNPSLDLAVAWGAAHFAWLKHTGGRRIGGGIARSYYVGIAKDRQGDKETEGSGDSLSVLCVVPQHLEEGQEIALAQPELELSLGQPVMFPLYTSTVRAGDKAGDLLEVAPTQLLQLPPLHTVLRGGKRSGTRSVPVTLAARCTEIGTLELFCVAKDGNNRWRLEFNVRDIVRDFEEKLDGPGNVVTDVWPEELVQAAAVRIRRTYGLTVAEGEKGRKGEGETEVSALAVSPSPVLPFSPSGADPKQLTNELEAALDAGRDKWPTGLCRRLWDFLAEVADQRRLAPAHLARWYNLVGFSLRPGFGDSLDRFRVEQLWKLLHSTPKGSKPGLAQPEGGADFWIMWRRVAGGLPVGLQNTLFNRLRPVLLPKANAPKPPANEYAEMWRAAASLERLDLKAKELLGEAALKSCRRSPTPPHGFFAITRLGARVLLYGPLNSVLHPQVVQRWLDALLPFEPAHQSERLAWAFCLTQLARKSGQRAIDIDDPHRQQVLDKLKAQQVPEHWARMVEEFVELEADEQSQMFGEALPIGLRLLPSND
ncbi:MAG: hsp70 family protein [Planctomycetes bacterium]|nr:hsp70 family protein [Planctomycetota bacterium]